MCASNSLLVFTFLFVTTHAVFVNANVHQWSHSYGDPADQTATSVALDNEGNVILIGHFDGTVDFGGGPLVSDGPSDCTFLAKLDGFGNHVWSHNLGDSLRLSTNKLAVDGSSNVLVVNDFTGTADFGGGVINAQGFRDGIIARFDAAGNHVWSRNFGGSSASVEVKAAGVDGSGNLIVAGLFTGTIDFGGATLTAAWFVTNMFVVKFQPNGAHLWSRRYTGGLIEITAVAGNPAGDVFVTGYHSGTFDLGGGPLIADLYNVFLVKYGATGDHAWSHTFGAPATYQHAYDVAADVSGNVFITGDYLDPLDLGGGDLVNNESVDIYLAKFDQNGNHLWSQGFGDDNPQRSFSVAVDPAGNVIIGGHSFGTVDFGHGPLVSDPIDFCVARFDGEGNHLWSRRFDIDNLGLPNDKEYAISAAMNVFGETAFVGTFRDAVDCGGENLLGSGGWDMFVAKFVPAATGIRAHNVESFQLGVHPNPFNPRTTITFSIPEAGFVRLEVYDVNGRLVQTLVKEKRMAGQYRTTWDGRSQRGHRVSSGVYFVRLASGGHVSNKKLLLLK